jgi:transposase
VFYTIRSERQLKEQLDYNLLYRWFVGLGVDESDGTQIVGVDEELSGEGRIGQSSGSRP